MVMSCVAGCRERRSPPRSCVAVGAHPRRPGRAPTSAARGVDVVDQDDLAPARARARTRSQPRAGRGRHREPGADVDDGALGHEVGLGRQRRRRGDERLDEAVAVGATRTSSQPSAARSTTRNGRLSSSSLASTTPVERHRGEVVERGDDRAHARRPGSRRVVVVATTTGPSASSNGSSASSSRCSSRRLGRALDEHVPQRAGARRARPRSDVGARGGPGPRRLRPRGTDRARPARATTRRARAATTTPNSGPTSGLVTKSRPARPAPPPRVKKPSSAVERELDERVERDRPLPVDALAPRTCRPASSDGAHRASASRRVEGELADAGEELRVDADDHHDDGGEPDARR